MRVRTVRGGAMGGAALAQLKLIQPQMQALGEGLDFVDRDPLNPDFARLRRLHSAYGGLDVLKLALAAPMLLSGDGQADKRSWVVTRGQAARSFSGGLPLCCGTVTSYFR